MAEHAAQTLCQRICVGFVGIYAVAIAYYFLYGNKHIRPFEEEFGVLDDLDEDA